jgi:hypothetical protein
MVLVVVVVVFILLAARRESRAEVRYLSKRATDIKKGCGFCSIVWSLFIFGWQKIAKVFFRLQHEAPVIT